MNPYQVLKVPKNATPERIRKAFRKLVLRHHPDRDGDRAEYEKVQLAYEVLSDPERREHYDLTGEMPAGPDNRLAVAAVGLTQAFCAVFNALREKQEPVARHDLVGLMRDWLEGAAKEVQKGLAEVAQVEARLRETLERFVESGEDRLLDALARGQLANLEKQRQQLEVHDRQRLAALAYLDSQGCSYRVDAPPPEERYPGAARTTTGVYFVKTTAGG